MFFDPENAGEEVPRETGISVVVHSDQFRLFDPMEGEWRPCEAEVLVFTIREDSIAPPGVRG